jgi:hypothetical protein
MTYAQKSMTVSEVLEIMGEVVDEFGSDFVYVKVVGTDDSGGRCLNWHGGCPSCLIGHVMHRWGMPETILAGFPNAGISTLVSLFVLHHADTKIEPGTVDVMAEAQVGQDEGVPWGECLTRARHAAATLPKARTGTVDY